MKTLILALLTLVANSTFSQQTIIWKGGTPGKEASWNEARNWSNNRVPDENSFVIIKQLSSGHNSQPVIDDEVIVASIEIQSGSILTIEETGELVVDGVYNYSKGITIYSGELINKGEIYFCSLAIEISDDYLNKFQNTGYVFVENKLIDCKKGNFSPKGQYVKGN